MLVECVQLTGSRQWLAEVNWVTPGGRVIKPGTYFDAGPELTIEEHCCIGIAILQDTVQQTNRQRQFYIHRYKKTIATDNATTQ